MVLSLLAAQGVEFQRLLRPRDVADIIRARNLFQLSSLVPFVLYYLRTSESDTKFPATISFTIRKGPPKVAFAVLWAMGWSIMFRVFRRVGVGSLFGAQMFLTGVLSTLVCSLGQNTLGRLTDSVHFFSAALYMVDHHVLFGFLNTKRKYKVRMPRGRR